jgi:hypothetical protein
MPSLAGDGHVREILVDVEKRRTRDVTGDIELPSAPRRIQLPPAIDELVAHGREPI